jgi:CheY-like chemotaxis protein
MDGLTCVRRIRELQQQDIVHGHVPVIAVTANVRSEQVEVALKAGMDDLISKPFRIPELYACIQKTLGRLAQK